MKDLSGKKIMVTSGGTREYIDDVRVVTNISTGALGAVIADKLLKSGAEVFYVHGKQSNLPKPFHNPNLLSIHPIVTANDLLEKMKGLINGFSFDAVIHSAAVSDFTFKRDKAIKLSSSSPEAFIDFLRDNITTTPKIINKIREWDPNISLIGFKFTVGCDNIMLNARDFLVSTGSCMIVANDKEEMTQLNRHRAHLVTDQGCVTYESKEEIAEGIANFLKRQLKKK